METKGNGKAFLETEGAILVNGELMDRATDLGRLMHDFSCKGGGNGV